MYHSLSNTMCSRCAATRATCARANQRHIHKSVVVLRSRTYRDEHSLSGWRVCVCKRNTTRKSAVHNQHGNMLQERLLLRNYCEKGAVVLIRKMRVHNIEICSCVCVHRNEASDKWVRAYVDAQQLCVPDIKILNILLCSFVYARRNQLTDGKHPVCTASRIAYRRRLRTTSEALHAHRTAAASPSDCLSWPVRHT